MKAWRRHLLERFQGVLAGKSWCFLTFTVPSELHGHPEKSVEVLQSTWKRMYDLLRRHVGEKLSYVYMYEAHQSGTYHLHALVSCGAFYDLSPLVYVWRDPLEHHPLHRWLRDTLPTLGAGWRCDVRRIYSRYGLTDGVSAVLYSIKYFAKAKEWRRFKKHARRIGVTRDIGGLPKTPKSDASWSLAPWLTRTEFDRENEVYDVSIRRNVTKGDFEYGFYPPETDGYE